MSSSNAPPSSDRARGRADLGRNPHGELDDLDELEDSPGGPDRQAVSAAPSIAAVEHRAEWRAPDGCRAIDIVSDLHLGAHTPRTTAAFVHWLEHTDADAVIVLGDLFEVWIGDDCDDDVVAVHVLSKLMHASKRLELAMMVGNRDFLVSPALLDRHGVVPLRDPCAAIAFGSRAVLSHGDAWCLDDKPYQVFRAMVRSSAWQREFLERPRAERAAIARRTRDGSEARKRLVDDDGKAVVTFADPEPRITTAALGSLHARIVVHGHTHRPRTHTPAVQGAPTDSVRHVTSDWDFDHAQRGEVLRWTQAGFERLRVTPPAGS
jgi:UDP-2,3-diacylglucosamine hydrolase